MPEDYEEFISLTRRMRNSKKPLGILERNWKRRWLQLCLARQARNVSMVRPVAKPMNSNQKFACILEASESTRVSMEEYLPNYHEDHIAGKGTIHYNITITISEEIITVLTRYRPIVLELI